MKSRIMAMVAGIAFLLLVVAAPARAMPEPPQASRADVYQQLGILHGANYVIVVDSSGSMWVHRTEVQNALRALLQGLTPADQVALVSFRRPPDPTVVVYPLSRLSSVAGLVAMLPQAYGGTDIGGGLSLALDVVAGANVGPTAVILITDAEQNDLRVTTPSGWDQLAQRVDELRGREIDGVNEIVEGYALNWGGDNSAPPFKAGTTCTATSSYTIMQCVFGRASTGELFPADATTALADLPLSFADIRFQTLLAGDAKAVRDGTAVTVTGPPVTLNPAQHTATIPIRITSHTQYLPLWAGDFTAQAPKLSGFRVTGMNPSYVAIAPGSSVTARLTVTWQSVSRPWYALGSQGINENISLGYQLESPWDELMSRATVATDRFAPQPRPDAVQLSVSSSTWWRIEPFLLLLILLLVVLWIVLRFAGLPTTLWVTGNGDQKAVAMRTWRLRTSHPIPGSPDAEVTTSWVPWRVLRGYAPIDVVVWPRGREEPGGPPRARHQVIIRRYRQRVGVPAMPGIAISWGGWLRPGRPPRN